MPLMEPRISRLLSLFPNEMRSLMRRLIVMDNHHRDHVMSKSTTYRLRREK